MSDPQDRGLELAGGTMPSARSIAAELKHQLNAAVLAERERRGEVRLAEDTWPMHRALARVAETCGEYSRAFTSAAKEARQVVEEELIDIVGESDGMPSQGMTVPDADGDVAITLDTTNVHSYDRDALYSAVAFEVMESMRSEVDAFLDPHLDGDEAENSMASLLILAMQRLTELGKFEPQVSKVRAFVLELARQPGADGVVSTVTSSHRLRHIYKGVKVDRKAGK